LGNLIAGQIPSVGGWEGPINIIQEEVVMARFIRSFPLILVIFWPDLSTYFVTIYFEEGPSKVACIKNSGRIVACNAVFNDKD
jgi:hypothetical protein